MELWIRSQDKEQLIKVDNIRIKYEYEQNKANDNYGRTCAYISSKYRCSYIYADSTWLGEFKTKERALEVLDEIQNILKPKIMLKYNDDFTMSVSSIEQQPTTYVYEMPKE